MPIDLSVTALHPATAWCRTWLAPSRAGRHPSRPRRVASAPVWAQGDSGGPVGPAEREGAEAGWLASSVALAAGLEVTELHGDAARRAWSGG